MFAMTYALNVTIYDAQIAFFAFNRDPFLEFIEDDFLFEWWIECHLQEYGFLLDFFRLVLENSPELSSAGRATCAFCKWNNRVVNI